MTTKTEIRDTYKEKRKNLSANYITKSTQIINAKLEQTILKNLKENSIIGGYYPIKNEINILKCLNNLSKQGIKIALPCLDKQKDIMSFRAWKNGDKLNSSQELLFPQPLNDLEIVIPSIIIVPLITCDNNGYRIGYGKGYYDKYMDKKSNTLLIGLCYAKCLYPKELPHENHDCKLDIVITEKKAENI
jgi:5-formyltetrahydrofolate cyclo-ligase